MTATVWPRADKKAVAPLRHGTAFALAAARSKLIFKLKAAARWNCNGPCRH